jgi:ADP-ribose pyrophosphatase
VTEPEIVYEGVRFKVTRRMLEGGDGRLRPYDLVAHPGAAVILPILDDGRVVMIENHRPAAGGGLLELPAGTIDPPEDPIDCARREITEETGYSAGKIEPLTSFYTSPGICDEYMHAFVATELRAGKTAHEPLEFIRVLEMTMEEALRRVADGGIIDGKTMVTLLYYDRYKTKTGRD